VLRTPMVELLKHAELLKEEEDMNVRKEEMERWLSYLALIHSSPYGDAKERKKFTDIIKPKQVGKKEIPQYETDISLLERYKAMQEGGKPSGNS
jgi:hypothetical protein